MKIEINRNLFLACMGLVLSGDDSYDHRDADLSHLVDRIRAAGFSIDARSWFAQARTGQVAVNPYWPRGSQLAAACFFISGQYHFDLPSYAAFLRSAGAPPDPLGPADFCGCWMRIRLPRGSGMIIAALYRRAFRCGAPWPRRPIEPHSGFGAGQPRKWFSAPTSFALPSRILCTPAAGSLRLPLAPMRKPCCTKRCIWPLTGTEKRSPLLPKVTVLAAWPTRKRCSSLAIWPTAQSAARALEDCFVRALSAVLSEAGEERLAFHVHSGFTGVPLIASYIRRIRPTMESLDALIKAVFSDTAANRT